MSAVGFGPAFAVSLTQETCVSPSAIRSKRSLGGKKLKDIKSVFQAIDKDGSGDLDHQEFTLAMDRLGLGLSQDQITQCIEVLDKDNDGEVSYDEFMTLVNKPVKSAVKAISAVNAFKDAGDRAAQKLQVKHDRLHRRLSSLSCALTPGAPVAGGVPRQGGAQASR